MTIYLHALEGCAPRPLGSYLKALAVLRLLGTQQDPDARGWWRGETWMLSTRLDRAALDQFFLERYAPTPTLSPWNRGSGFYNAKDALEALERSTAPRFEAFRNAIGEARAPLDDILRADAAVRLIKEEAKKLGTNAAREKYRNSEDYKARLAAAERTFKALKGALLPRLRRSWRGPHLDWMDAAITLASDASPSYPAMLGTGGSDGRFDFTNNFMQRLGELFDVSGSGSARPGADALLAGALWGETTAGLSDVSIGQFAPGSAGGANSSNGPSASGRVNPWDWVLALEGAILFAAATTRRLSANAPGAMSTPFMVRSHAAGHGSASASEDAPRGEQWLPLWSRPMALSEVRLLLSEGRAQVDDRSARQPLELARAIARLGVARGLDAFERYGYLERNGQSNLAVPLGRVAVEPRPHARLLDDVADWMSRLQREARGKTAAARLKHAERRLADAAFEAITHERAPDRWQALLLAMADIEALIAAGSGTKAGPIPRLRPEWIDHANDGSAELRLAVSLGLATALSAKGKRVDSVRHHWLPLDARGGLVTSDGRLARDPRVVAQGREPMSDLVGIMTRRLLEARAGAWAAPLVAAPGASAAPGDITALLAGAVDLTRTVRLARAFMAVDRRELSQRAPDALPHGPEYPIPDDAWLCVRAALSPWPLAEGAQAPPADLAIVQRLGAGDAEDAVRRSLRRLQSMGRPSALRVATADPATARLWAAALVFPLSRRTTERLAARIYPGQTEGA
jgi:CRISPR-associated protein Csx17